MSTPTLYVADLSSEEAVAGFAVQLVGHPEGLPGKVPAVIYTWGDRSHRLVKTSGRVGIVFQLQAFGRHPLGRSGPGWHAERYWPGLYGTAWVIDRLREHLGRPGYRPLFELVDPPDDTAEPAVIGSPVAVLAAVPGP
jgi:hypothetical protein